ncbi:MAG: hypothetical protein LUB59_02355 [Candidatus Gastranaerophilales bacterium]|nr:hypothetical protein [Candidatus Gastranaerophilales bacterium]
MTFGENEREVMKPTTLLIIAAGIGSCYQTDKNKSAIKQLEPVGLHDEIIMDLSIRGAIEAGFNKIVFVIRPDIESDFKERIGNRIEAICGKLGVEVAYTFQDIHEPFAVINADGYYGKNAFKVMHDWLILDHAENAIAMAGFILKNTLSEHGGVTRGICKVAERHTHVLDVVETSNILKTETDAEADGVKLDPESYVSMNFWGFPAADGSDPWYMRVLDEGFTDFFKTTVPANPMKAEYLLPTHIGGLLRGGKVTVKVLETSDKWFGVTYQEDREYKRFD